MMRSTLSFYAALISQYFLKVHTPSLSTPSRTEAPPTTALEPRQAPGVIAASNFLRRGYQACKCWTNVLTNTLIITV